MSFLVVLFARYKEYMIRLILFSKFSDVLLTFTYASAIGNLWSICLEVNILSSEILALQAKMSGRSFSWISLYLASDLIVE